MSKGREAIPPLPVQPPGTLDKARTFEIAQALRQHLVGEPRDRPAQLTVPKWTILEAGQDHRLPLATQKVQRQLNRTTIQARYSLHRCSLQAH
jgi:hypothetical protein